MPFLLSPVTSTLRDGFAASPDVAHVLLGHDAFRNDTAPLDNALAGLKRGDIFIWVGEFIPMWVGETNRRIPWQQLGDRGIWRILYQTEPVHFCKARRPGWPPSSNAALRKPVRTRRRGASFSTRGRPVMDELWDFSWHNLEACHNASESAPTTLRHVPIGAVPLGLSVQPSRAASTIADVPTFADTANSARRNGNGTAHPLLFVGNKEWGPLRRRCYYELRRLLGKRVSHTYQAWSAAAFASQVLPSHIFVNLHKDCGDAHNPVTWRSPMLANQGKLVLSERAHARDEVVYRGIIFFLDNVSVIARTYEELAASGAWRQWSVLAGLRFKVRFSPTSVFDRAGIYEGLGLRRPLLPARPVMSPAQERLLLAGPHWTNPLSQAPSSEEVDRDTQLQLLRWTEVVAEATVQAVRLKFTRAS